MKLSPYLLTIFPLEMVPKPKLHSRFKCTHLPQVINLEIKFNYLIYDMTVQTYEIYKPHHINNLSSAPSEQMNRNQSASWSLRFDRSYAFSPMESIGSIKVSRGQRMRRLTVFITSYGVKSYVGIHTVLITQKFTVKTFTYTINS